MTADLRCRCSLRALAAGALILVICALASPAFCQAAASDQPAPAATPPGVPVTLDGGVLFYFYQGIGPFTAGERAEAVERKLVRIAEDPFYSTDQIKVVANGPAAQILYRGKLVGVLSPEEAAKIGPGSTVDVATYIVRRIARSIERYRARRQPVAARRAAVLGTVATLLLAGLLFGLSRLNRRVAARIQASAGRRREPGVVETVVRQIRPIQLRALRVLRIAITVLLAGVYLLTIFDLFPLTQGFVVSVVGYVLDPVRVIAAEVWDNVDNFAFIAVIAVLSRLLLRGLKLLLSEAASGAITLPGVQSDWAMLLYKALRIVVVAIAAVMIYPYVPGSDSEAFKGIGLFAGALFTLGASGMAGNMIGGLALTFSGAFHIGDRVTIGDVTGDVVESTLLMTHIRSLQNEIVTIPNSGIMSSHIVNYSTIARTQGLLLTTEVTIGYDAPWRKVHGLLIDAALRTRNIVADPAPFVLQKSLNDYHISYVIWAYTRDASAMLFTHAELHQHIQDAFNEGGVEILSPAFAYLRDGNQTTIPAAYRPEGYGAPPFKVEVEHRTDAATSLHGR